MIVFIVNPFFKRQKNGNNKSIKAKKEIIRIRKKRSISKKEKKNLTILSLN